MDAPKSNTLTIRLVYILLFFSVILLLSMGKTIKPERYGDGFEYMYMSQAFENHLTPDVNLSDIKDAQKILISNNITQFPDPYIGFFAASSGKMYSFHFWLYSLICVPIKLVLKMLHMNEFRCFQLTNAFLLISALWTVYFYLEIDSKKKSILILLFMINPVIWYVTWTHTEVFSYSLVIISLAMFSKKNYKLAMLFSALSSTQNPPLLLLTIIYITFYLQIHFKSLNTKNIFMLILSCSPITIPSLFYFYNFGTLNLITKVGSASIKFISFKRIFAMIFDLNIGMFPYIPVTILLFFIIIITDIIQRNFTSLIWPLGILLMIVLSVQTNNFNHGCSGISRYNIWIIPIVIYYIVINIDLNKAILKYALFLSILVQGTIIYYFGGFICNISYLYFTPMSKFVLNHAPSLYSPEKEIFAERALHHEGITYDSPIIYSVNNSAVKILTNYTALKSIETNYNILEKNYYINKIRILSPNKKEPIYINLKKGVLVKK